MAILWADDFGSYGTNPALMANGPYAQGGSGLTADPDDDATGIVLSANANQGLVNCCRKVLPVEMETVGIAVRLWCANLPSAANISSNPAVFCDSFNRVQAGLYVTTTGQILVKKNGIESTNTTIAASVGPVILANAWNHVETKVTIGVAGSVQVRVNGVVVIDQSGVDTQGTAGPYCAQVRLDALNSNTSVGNGTMYKDFVIWDESGSDNNDFLGLVRCIRLPVNGDVDLGDWTLSSGTEGWDLLDESPPVDSSYIESTPAPTDPCIMDFENLPPDITRVYALMTYVRAYNSDGGDGKLQTSLVSDGVDADGTDRQITVAPTFWSDVQERDPDTDAPWTPASTDLARIKFNRTT